MKPLSLLAKKSFWPPLSLLAIVALLGLNFDDRLSALPTVEPTINIDVSSHGAVMENDWLKLGPRLIFSTVGMRSTPAEMVVLHNDTQSAVEVNKVVSNSTSFTVGLGPAGSDWIGPGATFSVAVVFTPNLVGEVQGLLTVELTGAPNVVIGLGGLNSRDFEGNFEPNLQQIVDAVGYRVNIAMPNKPPTNLGIPAEDRDDSISDTHAALGDEVLVPDFEVADPSRPVDLVPIASYVSRSKENFGWFGINHKGSATQTQSVLSFPGGTNEFGGQNQQLVPGFGNGSYSSLVAGSSISFKPEFTQFGIWDGARAIFSEDKLNYDRRHEWRIYPATNSTGHRIPNSYLLADDSGSPSSANYDYQDAVFILSNVQPAT